jgi:hypothetical protein
MKIFVLFDERWRHIEPDGDPETCPLETSPDRLVNELSAGRERLRATPIDDLIGLCDAAGRAWTQAGSEVARMVGGLGIGFLPLWLRRGNLEALLAQAVRSHEVFWCTGWRATYLCSG